MPDQDILSILFPGGGMNQDDNPLNFPPDNDGLSPFGQGDYRYARNVRIGMTTQANMGAIENIASSVTLTSYLVWNGSAFVAGSPPSGNNKCIGKYEDVKNNAFYAFVYNDAGNHVIYKVQRGAEVYATTITEILRWSGLNFKPDHIISAWMIGPYLGFTSNQVGDVVSNSVGSIANPPRIADTTDVYKLIFTLGASFQEYHISLAKWAPQSPPVLQKSTITQNQYLKYGIYQFSYRYIFKGGFKSTFSPNSYFYTNEINTTTIPNAPTVLLRVSGFVFSYNNRSATAINHNSIGFYQFVEYIELAYRESSIATWKLFQRYTVQTSANDTFLFTNSGPSSLIPTNESSQPFDSVPFYSGSGEAIDSRTMLADNTDELPVPDFDVDNISVVQSDPFISNEWNSGGNFTSLSPGVSSILSGIIGGRRFSFKGRGIYKLAIQYQHWSGRRWEAITMDKWTYLVPSTGQTMVPGSGYFFETENALQFSIPAGIKPPDGAVSYQILRSNCLNIEFFLHGVVNNYTFLQNEVNDLNDDVSTPDGIQTILNDYFDNKAIEITDQNRLLSDRIVSYIRKNKAVTTVSTASQIYIDISNWMLPTKADATASSDHPHNNLFYTFRKGDRVRFYGNVNRTGPSYDVFDEEIVEYTGKAIIINKPLGLTVLHNRNGTIPAQQEFFVEIYRPRPLTEDVIFYEMGEWYPVVQPCTPNRDFSKRDWVWTGNQNVTDSTVVGNLIFNKMPIMIGDVWQVKREMYYDYFSVTFPGTISPLIAGQMTQDPRKAYGTWDHNNGKPAAAYKYIPKIFEKTTQVRFGLRYLQDSVFNGINTFLDENQFIYPQEYGRIRALVNTNNAQVESVGNIMLAIGEIEAWSIYVNRTSIEDLSGRTQVSLSDQVLGSYNTLLGSFGTMNPDSVARRNGRVMWWSQRNSCWARYSRDGTTNVSEYKMLTWFRQIGDIITPTYAGTPAKVIAVYDNIHKEWLTLINHSSMPSTFRNYDAYKNVVFSELNKRWKMAQDFESADFYTYIGNDIYTIVGTTVTVHERGTTYGNFLGVDKPSQWEPVANVDQRDSKTWGAVEVIATDKWSAEHIRGDWRSNGKVQQDSKIQLSQFEFKEDRYVSAVYNDRNTPNAISEDAAIINGNTMRSRAITIFFQLDRSVNYLSLFNYAQIRAIDSPKNPRK